MGLELKSDNSSSHRLLLDPGRPRGELYQIQTKRLISVQDINSEYQASETQVNNAAVAIS